MQSAQDQYNQAILPFQQQLTNTLASDQQTYNTQVQTATNTFNGDMQTAGSDEATREAAADAAYNTSAQPLIDGYNTWLAGRSSQCQSDIATRQGQLATDLVGEDQTYNNTINGTASLPGLLPTEQSAIASANSTYAGQIATLNATRASEDAGVWNTFNSAVAGADQALAAAQNTYNQTVDQITNDAMQNNQPPDQSALNAAYNTLLAADHTHANSVASAAQALTSGLGADENEFVTNQKPYYVQKEDAIAAAEGAYEKGVAAAAKVRDDNDADHYASADADEATITSAYNDDVATHYETLQLSLAGFQSTRSDAYVDAQAQYADDAATAWQKEQKGIADAEQQQANDDAAAYENYDAQIIGPWQTMQNQLASAETQWAHDMAAAYASYATSMAAAQAQQVSGYESAYDTAVGDIEAGLNSYADIVSPALAAAVIAASGNDPNTTTWANAWASFNEQATALTASLMGQEAAQQDGVVGAVSAAYVGLVGQLNTESKNLEQQWGNGLVGLVSANVGAVAGYAGQVLPQALATQQDEINAARLEAGKEIDADAQDIRQHAANDDQDAKDHDAHTVAYAQAVLPVGLTTFIEVDDEVAKDAGTLEGDAAAFVKQMDGAAVTEVGNLVTDGEAMIHTEAGATCDYDIALTAQQVASANAAATANVTAVLNAPDSQFAGESFGGGMMFGDFTPTDPDSLMPDKDLPQPQGGFLSSFFSGVASFAQSLGQTVSDVLNGGAQLGQAALTLLANPTISWNDLLSSAGYLPGDYSIGAQSTSSGPVIVNSTAQLGVAFAMGNGLNWQFSQSNLLDSYANWFNSTFGSGYSNTVGNWIYDHMPVSDETLANAGDWQLFGATAAAATATVLGGYYLIPAAGSAIGSASSTIASMSWTPSIPYSFPAIFPTIGLDGTLAFTGISGVVSFTVTAADAAVVSAGSVLAYMVANGPIPNGPPDFSKNQDVLEARQLQQELNELIEAQTDAVESANHELAQWLQTAIEWTQQAISNLFK